MSNDAALHQARRMMSLALAPTSTAEDRRRFHSHLISLPASGSYESKSFFGTLVPKFFAEFEDLQDSAIDALLDLCEDEDEKIRMIGIKGLGPTAKADPRWVRGNTGVLLQLLASRMFFRLPSRGCKLNEAETRELKYVRESLHTLLTVSPSDVFSVMADDCRSSEDETGASRNNILDFLEYDSVTDRSELLESGKHTDVEDTFRREFVSVLPEVNQDEKKKIIKLLIPLSTVSGNNTSPETVAETVKNITRLATPESSLKKTQPIIQLFKEYLNRLPINFDTRLPLYFLSYHGAAVTQLSLKNDIPARDLMENCRSWALQSLEKWNDEKMVDDSDLVERDVVRGFVEGVLKSFVDGVKSMTQTYNFESSGPLFEIILFSVYVLANHKNHRSDYITPKLANDCHDLVGRAREAEARSRDHVSKWNNIRTMLEVLGNPWAESIPIIPSWQPQRDRVPSQSSSQASNQRGSMGNQFSRPPPQGPRAGSRGAFASSGPPYSGPGTSTLLPHHSLPNIPSTLSFPARQNGASFKESMKSSSTERAGLAPLVSAFPAPPTSSTIIPEASPASEAMQISSVTSKRHRDQQEPFEDRSKKNRLDMNGDTTDQKRKDERPRDRGGAALLSRLSGSAGQINVSSISVAPLSQMSSQTQTVKRSLRERLNVPVSNATTAPFQRSLQVNFGSLDNLSAPPSTMVNPSTSVSAPTLVSKAKPVREMELLPTPAAPAQISIKNRASNRPSTTTSYFRSFESLGDDDPDVKRKGRGFDDKSKVDEGSPLLSLPNEKTTRPMAGVRPMMQNQRNQNGFGMLRGRGRW
nr:hypothetical protein L203_01198 [Cryptococcus depauperatus CBS 7841]